MKLSSMQNYCLKLLVKVCLRLQEDFSFFFFFFGEFFLRKEIFILPLSFGFRSIAELRNCSEFIWIRIDKHFILCPSNQVFAPFFFNCNFIVIAVFVVRALWFYGLSSCCCYAFPFHNVLSPALPI